MANDTLRLSHSMEAITDNIKRVALGKLDAITPVKKEKAKRDKKGGAASDDTPLEV